MATTNVEMPCLQGLADLEQMKGHGLRGWPPATWRPATVVCLLRAPMIWTSKRLVGATVLDRMELELATTLLDADVCHAAVDNSPFCQPGCQQSDEGSSATARPNR